VTKSLSNTLLHSMELLLMTGITAYYKLRAELDEIDGLILRTISRYTPSPSFTPICFMHICFNAHCQFTPFLHFHSVTFGLTSFYWMRSVSNRTEYLRNASQGDLLLDQNKLLVI
jgi:hypothetical protein